LLHLWKNVVNVNVLPACGWLTKFIWPSISSTNHLLMVNPISVPHACMKKCKHLGLVIQWCEYHRAFHFSHKKTKFEAFPTVWAIGSFNFGYRSFSSLYAFIPLATGSTLAAVAR
jgi:hypothetical protein